jgi:hypothetical protein
MIADSHTHIFPPEFVADRSQYFLDEPAFKLLYDNPKSRLIEADDLIGHMDEAGVDHSVTFGFPWQSAALCRVGNDYVLEQAKKHPDRLTAFATLPCGSIDDALAEMNRCIDAGVAGLGELSFYCPTGACDEQDWMRQISQEAAVQKLLTLWHVTEDVGHAYPGKGGMNPKQAARLAEEFCGATMVFAHWGGGLPFFEMMPEIKKACATVYYDTAASPYLYEKDIFKVVAKIVGPDRILFGSDYPLISPKRYIKQIQSVDLDQDIKDAILGGNLMRLLRKEIR